MTRIDLSVGISAKPVRRLCGVVPVGVDATRPQGQSP